MEDNKLWCVAIADEPDSEFVQHAAVSKEIAERALARHHKLLAYDIQHPEILESCKECVKVEVWQGTPEEHAANIHYDEDWFTLPMYQCKNIQQMHTVFTKYKEIVHCYNGDQELITADYEEAKRFYGVA